MVAPNTKALVCNDDPVGNLTPKESESVNACLAHPFQSHVMAPTSTPPVFEIYNNRERWKIKDWIQISIEYPFDICCSAQVLLLYPICLHILPGTLCLNSIHNKVHWCQRVFVHCCPRFQDVVKSRLDIVLLFQDICLLHHRRIWPGVTDININYFSW